MLDKKKSKNPKPTQDALQFLSKKEHVFDSKTPAAIGVKHDSIETHSTEPLIDKYKLSLAEQEELSSFLRSYIDETELLSLLAEALHGQIIPDYPQYIRDYYMMESLEIMPRDRLDFLESDYEMESLLAKVLSSRPKVMNKSRVLEEKKRASSPEMIEISKYAKECAMDIPGCFFALPELVKPEHPNSGDIMHGLKQFHRDCIGSSKPELLMVIAGQRQPISEEFINHLDKQIKEMEKLDISICKTKLKDYFKKIKEVLMDEELLPAKEPKIKKYSDSLKKVQELWDELYDSFTKIKPEISETQAMDMNDIVHNLKNKILEIFTSVAEQVGLFNLDLQLNSVGDVIKNYVQFIEDNAIDESLDKLGKQLCDINDKIKHLKPEPYSYQ